MRAPRSGAIVLYRIRITVHIDMSDWTVRVVGMTDVTTDSRQSAHREASSFSAAPTHRCPTSSRRSPCCRGRHPARARRLVPAQRNPTRVSPPGTVHRRRDDPRRCASRAARPSGYRNRWIRTDSFTDPFPSTTTKQPQPECLGGQPHVVNHAGKTLASSSPRCPTRSPTTSRPWPAMTSTASSTTRWTAHPKICPTTGELHFFGYGKHLRAARHL